MSEQAAEVWTVQKVLAWTIEHLKKSGCETARLDAEILLAHARRCQRIRLYTDYEAPLSPEERATMRELVKRRATLEPVAYLVGHREFFGLDFEVGRGIFIPRADTETLVVEALKLAKEHENPAILDVCTGSGCVPAAIAANCKTAIVKAIELDPQVLEVARRNVARHKLDDRVQVVGGDLFAALKADERFDIITSNPPYICDGEIATLQRDVRDHEPHLALAGGTDGLDIVRRLIADGPLFLNPGGAMLLEIASEQAEAVVGLFAQRGVFEPAQIARDLGGRSRVVWAKLKTAE